MAVKIAEPIHFIGIGGSGMAPLAELGSCRGLTIQGSDVAENEATRHLSGLGLKIGFGHDAAHLGEARTVVVSSAIKDDNVELVAARRKGLKYLHRSDFLAMLLAGHKAITVAGTHGKTTTTAMVGHMLTELGCDPLIAAGGQMLNMGSAARNGAGPYFVAEADESDGSFLKYRPYVGILTNVDSDHLDFFQTREKLDQAFTKYLSHVSTDGCAVIGWDNAGSRQVGSAHQGDKLAYGFAIGSGVRAVDYFCREGVTTFKAVVETDIIACRLPAIGKHNVANALAALATARALDLDVAAAARALESFSGVARRLSTVLDQNGLRILDDYAHNPGKIAAAVTSVKEAWPRHRLYVVFQPHRFSRLQTMYDEFMAAFVGADHVLVLPVYSAGETASSEFPPEALASGIMQTSKVVAHAALTFKEAIARLHACLERPAVVLTLGAGDVWKVAHGLKELLGE